MKKIPAALLCALWVVVCAIAGQPEWRKATEQELAQLIPVRVVVAGERYPSRINTASGVADKAGRFIAGVAIDSCSFDLGCSYTHFFVTQIPIKIGDVKLVQGEYVFNYMRVDDDTEEVRFYPAKDSLHLLVGVEAKLDRKRQGVRQFSLEPPVDGKGSIHFGRFSFDYQLAD